jgi:hypothetical protein
MIKVTRSRRVRPNSNVRLITCDTQDEIPFLRQTLLDGKIDGSTYSGDCACLAGTMAHAKQIDEYDGENIQACEGLVVPVNANSPREKWFMGIREGDTPETSQIAKITLLWIDEALLIVDHIRGVVKEAV